MNNHIVKYILVSLWFVGLVFCLIIVLLAYQDIPDLFGKAVNQVIDTFSPQLATMLAFIFSDQFSKERKKNINKPIAILAIIISTVYVLFFCSIMFGYQMGRFEKVTHVFELFDNIRPKTSFLVTAIIAFYFASRK
jgi:hypothetical protein